MNYELALELKNAGFPQNWNKVKTFYDKEGELHTVGDCENFIPWAENPDGSGFHTPSSGGCGCCTYGIGKSVNDFVYAPTLSELIEACGEDFYALFHKLPQDRNDAGEWVVYTPKLLNGELGGGQTPEEAVANLWLALNRK